MLKQIILSRQLGDKREFNFQDMSPMRWRQQLVRGMCQKTVAFLRCEFED